MSVCVCVCDYSLYVALLCVCGVVCVCVCGVCVVCVWCGVVWCGVVCGVHLCMRVYACMIDKNISYSFHSLPLNFK